jgi:phage terminase large subunit-like protein
MSRFPIDNPALASAVLDAVEKKNRDESFVRYWEPFAYERKAFEKFTEDIKILVVAGGNRSGKTEVGAALTTAAAEGKDYFRGYPAWSWVKDLPIPDKGLKNIWIVGLDYKVLQNVIWHEKLLNGGNHPGFLPKDGSIENILERDKQIFLTEGRTITGMSADAGREKFQSASVPLIWIDEECDAEIFDECYQRTVDCGGRIIVTVTPLIDINSGVKTPWIFNLWEDMKNGRKDIAFVNLSVLDNPIVPEGEKQKLLEKWKGHPEERARLFGEFVRRSGLVYPQYSRKVHVKRTNPSPEWYTICSIDPAATGPTAALWGRVDASNNIHLYREYKESNLPVSEHVKNIKLRNGGDKVDLWLIDPTWGNQRTAEAHKTGQQLYRDAEGPGRGLPVRLAEVGEDYGLLASVEYMQGTAAGPEGRLPRVWIDPSLQDFIEEVEHYTWDFFQRGPLKGTAKDKPRKRNDHLMNCWQYMAAMRPKGRNIYRAEMTEEQLQRQANTNSYF